MSTRLGLLVFALGALAWGQSSDSNPKPKERRLMLFDLSGIAHTYRSDDGNKYRYGTPFASFTMGMAIGFTTRGNVFGGAEGGGMMERVRTPVIPTTLLNAADTFHPAIDLNRTSLRRQDNWQAAVGGYVLPNLLLKFRYSQLSWRYDWLYYGAGTTIPYLKGMMWNKVLLATYDKGVGPFVFIGEAGGGWANASFSQGEESWLKDGRQRLIESWKGGNVYPWSATLGFNLLRKWFPEDNYDSRVNRVMPYFKYEYAPANILGVKINDRRMTFGIQIWGHGG